MLKWEKALCEALWTDLHKSYEEAYITEISILLGEIRGHIHKVRKWSRPQRVGTPLKMFPSSSRIISEPLGNALIIAPWNYPVQLLLTPLGGSHILRLHRRSEAVALRAERLQGHAADDRGHFQ